MMNGLGFQDFCLYELIFYKLETYKLPKRYYVRKLTIHDFFSCRSHVVLFDKFDLGV